MYRYLGILFATLLFDLVSFVHPIQFKFQVENSTIFILF